MENKTFRVRIAPSPTGYPHIGTVYQALFNYGFAHKNNGKFIVRIEDTDRERFVEGSEDVIFAALDWFCLTEDESPRKGGPFAPYRQSERLPLYQKHALELIEKGHAYYCFCSKERLEEVRKKMQAEHKPPMYDKHCRTLSKEEVDQKLSENASYVVRLKIPQNTQITVHDEIRGDITFDTNLIDDQVLLKADGYPTYHLAVVVDDHLMEITHAVRAEEWISSTPKHFLLYDYFGWERPLFYHTALLRNPDKSKLSKRHGHTNVNWYREEGYLPEAILNYLALLAWGHPEEKEIFPLSEFIQLVDLKDLSPVGPIFDLTKLTWMNQQYIQMLSEEDLKKRLQAYSPSIAAMDEDLLTKLIPLVHTRMQTLKEFEPLVRHFFEEPQIELRNDKEKEIVQDLLHSLPSVNPWMSGEIFSTLKEVMQRNSIRMPLLYYVLTGNERGLPLPESLEILGKERTLERLSALS